jgi:hypothetical protein
MFVGIPILLTFLLAIGIFIGIRPRTTLSTSSKPSDLEPARAVANSNTESPGDRNQQSTPEPRSNTGSSSSAPRESVSQFSGFTTTDRPIASSKPKGTQAEEVKDPLPLALRSVDPEYLKITPEQQQIINDLRQSFVDQMTAAKLAPDDPRYAALWEQLQPQIDQQLRALLGQEFFLEYERAAQVEK